ncbi:MAG: hypothetical protein OWU33_03395 [Firmicutes bacterium]|nr:hypothetical protein [Bacillota bacterium]
MAESSSLPAMFNVDLWAVAWIAVAILVVSSLSWHFYRGLEAPPVALASKSEPPAHAAAPYWVSILAAWWALDTWWHARAQVVMPSFWRAWPHTALPMDLLAWHLWIQNPMDWDFLIILIDGSLAIGLWLTVRRPPTWLLWVAMGWGLVRWWLAAAAVTWFHHLSIGPGGYFLAAVTALVAVRPQHARLALSLVGCWLAAIAITVPGPPSWAMRIAFIIGFMGLPLTHLWRWPRPWVMVWAAFISGELLVLGLGLHFWHQGPNTLWPPFLALFGVGLWINNQVEDELPRGAQSKE